MKRGFRETAFVALAALVARLAWLAWAQGRFPATADGEFYDTLARRLALGEGYTWAWPDGAVTYAAHYPVGYPAILAAAYALFGASLNIAGLVNAFIGALAAVGAHRLLLVATSRGRAYAGAIVVAVHPALVPYTSAVMTEGVTAALVVVSAAIAGRARATRGSAAWGWLVLAGLVLGVATLVRPQCLLLAPALGAIAMPIGSGVRRRGMGAALVTCAALACCLPWTARNCSKMQRCALVSVNGGWNLLIGAQTPSGAWTQIDVPPECRTVWDEAKKDACFQRAARATIVAEPRAWLAHVPQKLAATFDYFGAAPWYLHAANPAIFSDVDKTLLGAFETILSRGLLLAALVAVAALDGPRRAVRLALTGVAIAFAITEHAWPAYVLLTTSVAMLGPRRLVELPIVVSWSAVVIFSTVVAHAAFFGAGRYGLLVVPLVSALAFVRLPFSPAAVAPEPGRPLRVRL